MKNKKPCKFLVKFICFIVTLFLIGCGGGSQEETQSPEPDPPVPPAPTPEIIQPGPASVVEDNFLKGSAAAGAPIDGIVTVKGAKGSETSTTVDAYGKFSLNVSALKAPFVLKAEGRVNGKSVLYYSVCTADGHINITPLTNLIFFHVLKEDATGSFEAWGSVHTKVTAEVISEAEKRVRKQITPILNANGVPDENVDLMKTEFDANNKWLDGVLDILDINISENDITITNLVTSTTITDSLHSKTPGQFSSGELQATWDEIKNANSIADIMRAISGLYESGRPSSQQLIDKLAYKIAIDFFENGVTKSTLLENWYAGDDGPLVGMKYSATVIGPMDPDNYDTKLYEKGSWVRMNVLYNDFSESFITSMVYDGKDWLWYGNRQWINAGEMWADSIEEIGHSGIVTYYTGFNFSLEDRYYYAYTGGVRSAIVTGPGLTDSGLTLSRNYPEKKFRIYGHNSSMDGGIYRFQITDDTVLGKIPENSVYTVQLFKDSPESVTTKSTPLHTFSRIVSGRPHLNADLKKETFITITTPTNHRISSIDTNAPFKVFWSSPSGTPLQVTSGWIILVDENGVSHRFLTKTIDNINKNFSLDLASYPGSTITNAELWVHGVDIAGRRLETKWKFYNGIPIANAGTDKTVETGKELQLDGSLSSDSDSEGPLTYFWAVENRPVGSEAMFPENPGMTPLFTPDISGTYVFSLKVSDGQYKSTADKVTITAVTITLQGPAPSNPGAVNTLRPTWSWASNENEGTALFRIKLDGSPDDMATGSKETDATQFTPVDPLSEGIHTLFIQEKNIFGAWSNVTVAQIDVDLTQPQPPSFLAENIVTQTNDQTPTWSWTSGQGGAGVFRLKLGNNDFTQGTLQTENFSYSPDTPLTNGTHTLYLQERDAAGNWSEVVSFPVSVDIEGPEIIIDSHPASPTNQPDATFTFSSSEAGTTFKCNKNGQGFLSCLSPKKYTNVGVTSGTLTFAVVGIDALGNEGPAKTFQWEFDINPPTKPTVTGTEQTSNPKPTWTWTSGGAGMGTYRYKLDSSDFTSGAVETTSERFAATKNLAQGPHTLYVQERDLAGNWSDFGSFETAIDLGGLGTQITSCPADPTNQTTATFEFSVASEQTAQSFECRINGSTYASCPSPATFTDLSPRTHLFEVRAVDDLGNPDPVPASCGWTVSLIEPDPPTVACPTVTNNLSPTWSWISGGNGNGAFRYKVDSNDFSTGATETTTLNFTPTFSFQGSGTHVLYVQERDAAGNWSSEGSCSVVVDADPPVITLNGRNPFDLFPGSRLY